MFAIVGNDMKTRTMGDDDIQDYLINLGSKSVETTPFGAGIIFQCIYPLTVDVSSEGYTVHGASMIDVYTQIGSLAGGFEMSLNNGEDPSFILGSVLPVAITWTINSMVNTLTFFLEECTVTHGSTTIKIIKEGCYAAELDVIKETSLQAFSYKVFKGVGETSTSQSLECTVSICEKTNCQRPSVGQCPSTGDDVFYRYQL